MNAHRDILRGIGALMAAALATLIPWQLTHEGTPRSHHAPPAAGAPAPTVTTTQATTRIIRVAPSRAAGQPVIMVHLRQPAPQPEPAPVPGRTPRPHPTVTPPTPSPTRPHPSPTPTPARTPQPPQACVSLQPVLQACLPVSLISIGPG